MKEGYNSGAANFTACTCLSSPCPGEVSASPVFVWRVNRLPIVVLGDGGAEAGLLNERWLTYMEKQRPFVHLKIAMSLDGKVATCNGESRWITGREALWLAHQWRDSHEAILVGANTVRHDNAALTVRLDSQQLNSPFPIRQPIRVVIAGHRPLPPAAQLFQDGPAPTLSLYEATSINRGLVGHFLDLSTYIP